MRQVADDIIGPDVWQAADDVLRGKTDVQVAAKEVPGLWSEVQQAVSGLGSGAGETTTTGRSQQETSESGWEELKKDVERAAAGAFGDVRKCHRVGET